MQGQGARLAPPPGPDQPSDRYYFERYADHRDLHSFPTRRSSDLFPRVVLSLAYPPGNRAAGVEWQQSREIGRATSELQSRGHLVCRLLLEKKTKTPNRTPEATASHVRIDRLISASASAASPAS